MAKPSTGEELQKFTDYLKSESNEDAKRADLFPLFKKLFKDKLKSESDAHGADVYVEGKLIVECKSSESQWLEGFYQALHYQKKYGLAYNTVIVLAHKFVAIWKLTKLPEFAVILSKTADATKPPNVVGKENARKTIPQNKKEIKDASIYWLSPKDLDGDIFVDAKNLITESYAVLKILNNLESDRIQINPHNFVNTIEQLKPLFEKPIDAVHAFYTIVAYWDITSKASINEAGDEVTVFGFNGVRHSESVSLHPHNVNEFIKFVNTQYIFTNEGSGLTVDHYFSRFDEVMARIDPEYVKQHGIFFTDSNLSKFALWYAKYHFPGNINEDYIVFDPAGGSGNLVSSWRGKLKHKIISELQPDLLRTIERRMKVDPFHIETGFTIVPKTSENKGLNFLDHSASDYLAELKKELSLKSVNLDKPLAFLLNPPYKNIKENEKVRDDNEANYNIDQSILEITGDEAAQERYLAFLGQILNMSKVQAAENLFPILLVFTPTSWLIPRPAFKKFREIWDANFKYESGFIVTSNEFFKLDGKWPLAFTIWAFNPSKKGNTNSIKLVDLSDLVNSDLKQIDWNLDDSELDKVCKKLLKRGRQVELTQKETLRTASDLKLYDFIRTPTKTEKEGKEVVGGLPIKDERRKNNKTYGVPDSEYIGFMDDSTPVRIRTRGDLSRFSKGNIKSVWFRLDTSFKDINKCKAFNGPSDTRSYCANDLSSAKATFSWFSISKSLVGRCPVSVNQLDIWSPILKPELEKYWYSLCFAYVLAENRCVVTKFEKDNPVKGLQEVFIDNSLCPTNPESFWCRTLDEQIVSSPDSAKQLVDKVKELYKLWNTKYCKGQWLNNVGLHNESYFKYFNYADFLTPHSGLIQIRKYADNEGKADLLNLFSEISTLTKKVREEIYTLLTVDFNYFE